MQKCTRCGALLERPDQRCRVCSPPPPRSLPTLQQFADRKDTMTQPGGVSVDLDDTSAGLKTLVTYPEQVEKNSLIPPRIERATYSKDGLSTQPLVSEGDPDGVFQTHNTNEDWSEVGEVTELTDHAEPLFHDDLDQATEIQSAQFLIEPIESPLPSSSPPPVPPAPAPTLNKKPLSSRRSSSLLSAPVLPKVTTRNLFSITLSRSTGIGPQSTHYKLKEGGPLILSENSRGYGRIMLTRGGFQLAQEGFHQTNLWRPIVMKYKLTSGELIRWGMYYFEVTKDKGVLDQPEHVGLLKVWNSHTQTNLKGSLYGVFPLLAGSYRVGGLGSEIILPDVARAAPLFSLDLSPLDPITVTPLSSEGWCMIAKSDVLPFGSVLSTDELLFTVVEL